MSIFDGRDIQCTRTDCYGIANSSYGDHYICTICLDELIGKGVTQDITVFMNTPRFILDKHQLKASANYFNTLFTPLNNDWEMI